MCSIFLYYIFIIKRCSLVTIYMFNIRILCLYHILGLVKKKLVSFLRRPLLFMNFFLLVSKMAAMS